MKNLIWSKWKGLNLSIVLKNFKQTNARRLLLIATRGVYFWQQNKQNKDFNTDSRKTRDLLNGSKNVTQREILLYQK